jgi:hypothetical protein
MLVTNEKTCEIGSFFIFYGHAVGLLFTLICIMIFYFIFIFTCRQADFDASVLSPVLLTQSCKQLREFLQKFAMVPIRYSGARGKLICEENLKSKNLVSYSL